MNKQLKTFTEKDYKVLWHCGFWDGALSGCLKTHDGEFLFFDCIIDDYDSTGPDDDEETEYIHYRVYALYKPTDEQKEYLISSQNYWEKALGYYHTNWDYRYPLGNPDRFSKEKDKTIKKPEGDFPEFDKNQIIGFTTMKDLYESAYINGQRKK